MPCKIALISPYSWNMLFLQGFPVLRRLFLGCILFAFSLYLLETHPSGKCLLDDYFLDVLFTFAPQQFCCDWTHCRFISIYSAWSTYDLKKFGHFSSFTVMGLVVDLLLFVLLGVQNFWWNLAHNIFYWYRKLLT